MSLTESLPFALALGLAAASLVLSIVLWVAMRQFARRESVAEQDREKLTQQLAVLQETLRSMGRQLIDQEQKLNALAGVTSSSLSPSDVDTEVILQRLDEGQTVAEIVKATGLAEVEVTLLKQIRDRKASEHA